MFYRKISWRRNQCNLQLFTHSYMRPQHCPMAYQYTENSWGVYHVEWRGFTGSYKYNARMQKQKNTKIVQLGVARNSKVYCIFMQRYLNNFDSSLWILVMNSILGLCASALALSIFKYNVTLLFFIVYIFVLCIVIQSLVCLFVILRTNHRLTTV